MEKRMRNTQIFCLQVELMIGFWYVNLYDMKENMEKGYMCEKFYLSCVKQESCKHDIASFIAEGVRWKVCDRY